MGRAKYSYISSILSIFASCFFIFVFCKYDRLNGQHTWSGKCWKFILKKGQVSSHGLCLKFLIYMYRKRNWSIPMPTNFSTDHILLVRNAMLRNISLQTKTLAKLSILIQIGLKLQNTGVWSLQNTGHQIFPSVPQFRIFNPFYSDWFPIHIDMRGSRGRTGGPEPHEKSQKISVFLAILVKIPWKITKLPSQHSMLGHHRPASETPFKLRFACGPIMADL